LALNAQAAGKIYPVTTYELTAETVRRFAGATNERNPMFFEDEPLAPPAFPTVPALPLLNAAMNDEELEVDLALMVHGAQEHIFHRPLKAGDVLEVRGSIDAVELEETGHSFTVLAELVDPTGETAVEVRSRLLIRRTGSKRGGDLLPRGETLFEVTEKVDEDQAARYAEASGDRNPIHLDAGFARNEAGLPGIILHGMCTMAFACRAVLDSVAGSDPCRLRRIAVKFSRPVFPGQTLTTRGWRLEESPACVSFGFETVNEKGSVVIGEGVAELAHS
jgi:acyl dehydratase